jgi:hypothetical protein
MRPAIVRYELRHIMIAIVILALAFGQSEMVYIVGMLAGIFVVVLEWYTG